MALAGVGQLAAPFQEAWVLSKALQDIQGMGIPILLPSAPLEIMQKIAFSLLQKRDELFGFPIKTELILRFGMALSLWGHSDANEKMKYFAMPPKEIEVVQTAMQNSETKCDRHTPLHPTTAKVSDSSHADHTEVVCTACHGATCKCWSNPFGLPIHALSTRECTECI